MPLKHMGLSAQAEGPVGADCSSQRQPQRGLHEHAGVDDLKGANPLLQPVFHLADTLMPTNECQSVKMAEAMVLLRDAGLCELLLSLLRRLPWAQMEHECAEIEHGLALLPNLLQALCKYLGAATSVRSSQQAAACAEMSNRCASQARLRTAGCAAKLPSLKAQEHTTLSALSELASAKNISS